MPITNTEKLECASRELRMREQVYPRWIAQGKIREQKARYELTVMRAIVDDYRKLADKEKLV